MRHLLGALLLCSVVSGAGAAPVGYVKTVQGEAIVITAGSRVRAEPGTPIYTGSQIRTGKGASLGLSFIDNTVMSFGAETDFVVDEYVFNPAQGELKFGSHIARGTLTYLSGTMAKLQPDAVKLKTPAGLIGVRGTHFALRVAED